MPLLFLIFLFLISCEKNSSVNVFSSSDHEEISDDDNDGSGTDEDDEISDTTITDTISRLHFELISNLEQDQNGFYLLELNLDNWQTLHRLDGIVTRDSLPCRVIEIGWWSPFHWIIGDTLGYVLAHNGLNEALEYVVNDTAYLTWFSGYEVPIVNGTSYSNDDGEISTMIAPVQSMQGDTIQIYYGLWDNWRLEEIQGNLNIILE